ncbi:MAG: cation:proton antiporter, partial [Bifidobacteriaceae bacterium]|nr:cation:proton antiporter [Bifidobacteriaceae bacterium]
MTTILFVILGAVGVSALARRRMPQPGLLVVVLAGAISFIPAMPRLTVPPGLVFSLIMPPLLYSAAMHFSFQAMLRNLRAIVGLGLVMVIVTAASVGLVTAWIAPMLGVAGAAVLGAVASPPDTVTIVTRGRQMGLPQRVVDLLTGESLVNDAAALTLFAVAVSHLEGAEPFISNQALFFLYGSTVGLFIGLLLGNITVAIRRVLADPTLESVLGLLLCFLAYFAAEHVHASGVLAVVMAAFTVAVHTSYLDRAGYSATGHLTRLTEHALWPVVDALLEAFVFAYMGLQLRWVIADVLAGPASDAWLTLRLGLAVLATVIVVRIAWTAISFGRTNLAIHLALRSRDAIRARWRRLPRRSHLARRGPRPKRGPRRPGGRGGPPRRPPEERVPMSWKEIALVAWTGMRGIVTLAAAAEVPAFAAGGGDGAVIVKGVAF